LLHSAQPILRYSRRSAWASHTSTLNAPTASRVSVELSEYQSEGRVRDPLPHLGIGAVAPDDHVDSEGAEQVWEVDRSPATRRAIKPSNGLALLRADLECRPAVPVSGIGMDGACRATPEGEKGRNGSRAYLVSGAKYIP
jgi:hypothetical protein